MICGSVSQATAPQHTRPAAVATDMSCNKANLVVAEYHLYGAADAAVVTLLWLSVARRAVQVDGVHGTPPRIRVVAALGRHTWRNHHPTAGWDAPATEGSGPLA